MKNNVSLFIVFIIAAFFSAQAFGQGETAPEIFFEETSFTAADVTEGTPIEHTYSVHNKGNALLRIAKVSPG